MISKQEISSASDAAVYHDKSFNQEASQKADNYYVNEKATAHWQGKGAEFTTPAAIDSEMRLARNIHQGRGKGNVVLTDEAEFVAAVNAFNARKTIETGKEYRLSSEQVNAAHNILMHPDTYQGVQGEAGTGKTAANALVYEVATAKGWEVLGVATSAAAATELEAASGIPSNTIAGYFAERDKRIKATELRLDELRATINANTPLRHSPDARIESRKLHVRSGEINYGKHRYTFDHQRGKYSGRPTTFAMPSARH
jgi:hypothetical protein